MPLPLWGRLLFLLKMIVFLRGGAEVRNEIGGRLFLLLRSNISFLTRPSIDADIQRIRRECPLQLILLNPCFSEAPFSEYCAGKMIAGAVEHPNLFQIVRACSHSIRVIRSLKRAGSDLADPHSDCQAASSIRTTR